jgi:hypothetical protein
MIARSAAALESRTAVRNFVGIVEADQPLAVGCVQRERVRQTVGTCLGRAHARALELEPIASLEVMNAAVEGQQELGPMFVDVSIHIISGYE